MTMNEDVFNMSLRKFLKKVGVTSQREIEKAVRDALDKGRLKGHETLDAQVTIKIGGIQLTETIDGRIELA
jgi:ribosomal protein L1